MFRYCLDGDIEGVKKYIADVDDINWRNEVFDEQVHTGFRNIKTLVCQTVNTLLAWANYAYIFSN